MSIRVMTSTLVETPGREIFKRVTAHLTIPNAPHGLSHNSLILLCIYRVFH